MATVVDQGPHRVKPSESVQNFRTDYLLALIVLLYTDSVVEDAKWLDPFGQVLARRRGTSN